MSAADLDPYEALGIKRDAGPDDIKAAYQRVARESHPDHHPGDAAKAERFRQATAARDLLSDPARREAYDRQHPPRLSGSQLGLAVADLYDVGVAFMTGNARRAVGELLDRTREAHWNGIGTALRRTPPPAGATQAESELARLQRENRELKEVERLRAENERLRSAQARRKPGVS